MSVVRMMRPQVVYWLVKIFSRSILAPIKLKQSREVTTRSTCVCVFVCVSASTSVMHDKHGVVRDHEQAKKRVQSPKEDQRIDLSYAR